jgi:16S rRNA (guanine527-N7)-methyltransferase
VQLERHKQSEPRMVRTRAGAIVGGAVAARDPGHDRERALALFHPGEDTVLRLDKFVTLLLQWQKTTNLVAPSTLPQLWTRHIADSLQLLPLAASAKVWVDLGSGAGFPGLVIACAIAEQTGARVNLVESNAKKAAFLREAARITGVPATVHAARAENFVRSFEGGADVVTARALAPLSELIELAAPMLQRGAIGIFPKGKDAAAELAAAGRRWRLKADLVPSKTSPDGRIVVIHSAELSNKQ